MQIQYQFHSHIQTVGCRLTRNNFMVIFLQLWKALFGPSWGNQQFPTDVDRAKKIWFCWNLIDTHTHTHLTHTCLNTQEELGEDGSRHLKPHRFSCVRHCVQFFSVPLFQDRKDGKSFISQSHILYSIWYRYSMYTMKLKSYKLIFSRSDQGNKMHKVCCHESICV